MKGLAKEHKCITHGHRQQCGDGQREGGAGLGRRGTGGGKMGTSVTMSTIKNKEKKRNHSNEFHLPMNHKTFPLASPCPNLMQVC